MRFGKIIVEHSADPTIFAKVVTELDLKPPVIIKPNWGTVNNYTEAKVIDGILTAIDAKSIIVESYGWARTEDALMGKGKGSQTKDDLRKSDQWFLDISGVGEVLKKHGAEYLNITEEVWANRTVDPDVIKKLVKFKPIQFEEMYSYVPKRLFDMREGTFLSLAKYRFVNNTTFVTSLSLKNLFGMIPGPGRWKFHGDNDSKLDQSIVDINKIYHSLFNVKGIVDAVLSASIAETLEETINPKTVKNAGLLLGCEDCVKLDAFVASLEGKDPNEIGYLKLASKHFGSWDETDLNQAKQSGLKIF